MFSILALLFIGLPLLELTLLLELGRHLGLAFTMAVVILTGVLGAALARYEGLKILFHIRNDLSKGQIPAPYLLDGLMILVAGAVLLTPGLITDVGGFLLLIPAVRTVVKGWVRKKIEKKVRQKAVRVTYWDE
ncbi:MAG: hypothetical protein GKR87_08565 [Kiritimatiellae bacterium]|nr:hypothetical protein [Kiritimatiellia bacterium]